MSEGFFFTLLTTCRLFQAPPMRFVTPGFVLYIGRTRNMSQARGCHRDLTGSFVGVRRNILSPGFTLIGGSRIF